MKPFLSSSFSGGLTSIFFALFNTLFYFRNLKVGIAIPVTPL